MRLLASLALLASVSSPALAQRPAPGSRVVDTTFAADTAGRIQASNVRGRLVVVGWDEPRIRVRATVPAGEELRIGRNGAIVEVSREARNGDTKLDIELHVPRASRLELNGRSADIDVRETWGVVRVNGALSRIRVTSGRGALTIDSSTGAIDVTRFAGSMSLSTAAGPISVASSEGQLTAESNAGSITLLDVTSRRLSAITQRGDVTFRGAVLDAGAYELLSHGGRVLVELPDSSDVTINARVLIGRLHMRLPASRRTRRDDGEDVVLGAGAATMRASTFSGTLVLQLLRPARQAR